MKTLSTTLLCLVSLLCLTQCSPLSLLSTGYTAGRLIAEDRSTTEILDDAKIKASLMHEFVQNDVDDMLPNVNYEVHRGRVMLTGSVDSAITAERAVEIAKATPDVNEVINRIVVKKGADPEQIAEDYLITKQVEGKLLLGRDIRSPNYRIATENGVVYMLGVAQDKEELKISAAIASRVPGVQRVVSYVRIDDGTETQAVASLGKDITPKAAVESRDTAEHADVDTVAANTIPKPLLDETELAASEDDMERIAPLMRVSTNQIPIPPTPKSDAPAKLKLVQKTESPFTSPTNSGTDGLVLAEAD